MKLDAITRLIVFAILLVNQALIVFGYNPLPFEENEIYEGVSMVLLTASGIWAWWKNNSITKEAQKADKYLNELKKKKVSK